jgi:hypothetical protein
MTGEIGKPLSDKRVFAGSILTCFRYSHYGSPRIELHSEAGVE